MKALFFKAKLYVLAFPVLLYVLGAASNQAVFAANKGRFPVRLNPATMYAHVQACDEDQDCLDLLTEYGMLDARHSVMTDDSQLKFLADWIDLGGAIYSPGDLLLELGSYLFNYAPLLWAFLMIQTALSRQP